MRKVVNKLRIEASNYEQRSQFYYIVAPQDCYITRRSNFGDFGETLAKEALDDYAGRL